MCFDTDNCLRNERKINQMVAVDNVCVEKSMNEEKELESVNFGARRIRASFRVRTHLSTCSPSDPSPFKCPDCTQKFSSRNNVFKHMSSAHKKPEELQPSTYKKEELQPSTCKKEEVVRKPNVDCGPVKLQFSSVQPKWINNHKCRICLNKVFRTTANLNDEKLYSLFISITGIDVRKTPEISTLICGLCERNVLQFHNFQEKCWESDIFLRLNDTSLLQ